MVGEASSPSASPRAIRLDPLGGGTGVGNGRSTIEIRWSKPPLDASAVGPSAGLNYGSNRPSPKRSTKTHRASQRPPTLGPVSR